MSAVSGGGGNYISDGQIMQWLANQQDRIYSDLRESMDLSEQRADLTNDLNTIKSHLQEANDSGDFSKVNDELQAFVDKYGADPRFKDLCEGIDGIATRISNDYEGHKNFPEAHAKFAEAKRAYDQQQAELDGDLVAIIAASARGALLGAPTEPIDPGAPHYSENQLKSWDELISSKTDSASKNDQLTMIHIQELKATLDQGSQLASTFISSGDKTSSAIINNIA
jgi:hypothetical protein